MKVVVIGAGSWGSTFASLLAERAHDVWLQCRDPEQARAIAETGRNPRYVPEADLSGVTALRRRRGPEALGQAELVCVAVPSAAFREVVDGVARDRRARSSASSRDSTRIRASGSRRS